MTIRQAFLFRDEGETGAGYVYFVATSPAEVKRKYPTLEFLESEPPWTTSEMKRRRLRFDIRDHESTHPYLTALALSAEKFYASLGEQVAPPRDPRR